ncbi:MAG: Si-specific NAD(P)(+) transhydrogenase [Rhabdochlamydiaceae bacterium]
MYNEIFDLVVIGSGPAGEGGAIQAAKLGKKVLLIEQKTFFGGSSLNSGTIPSKCLREAILDLTGFYERSFYGYKVSLDKVSISDLNYRFKKVVDKQRQALIDRFKRNHIQTINGKARFIDTHHVMIERENHQEPLVIESKYFLIATGSKPRHPIYVPFDQKTILDTNTILNIERLPKNLLVLGGGVVGSEYGSFFATLGAKVTVADKKSHLLSFLDREISDHLQTLLKEQNLEVFGHKEPQRIEKNGESVDVYFNDGSHLSADMLLYAVGREANVDFLDIDKIGIELDSYGNLPVNPLFQTLLPHIYAAGDVIGRPSLASTSLEQGRLVARHAFGDEVHYFPSFFPIGIYTIPEISCCGYTEEDLKKKGFNYGVGRGFYEEIARNQIAGNDPGMFKILFHNETLEILGVHIIGRQAAELIHIGQIAMSFGAKVDYFIEHVFNYPTYAEGYRIAALNGLNKIRK